MLTYGLSHLLGGFDSKLGAALHRGCIAHEIERMPGMYFVRKRVSANVRQWKVTPVLSKLFVHGKRAQVVVDGSLIIANAHEDMRGHVHHVTTDG